MANSVVAVEPGPRTKALERSDRGAAAIGGVGFDWLMVALGAWLIGGLYLDGWAHIHVPALETFFTPWHAVLYSGYLAGAAALAATFYLTLLLSVNVALMATIHDKYLDTGPAPLIGAAVLAGLAGDVVLWWLRPSPDRIHAFRTVAFAIPAVHYLLHFAAIMVWARVTWSVHLWTGAIVIAGGVGWLLSYLVVAPGRSAAPLLTHSDSTTSPPRVGAGSYSTGGRSAPAHSE